jgi:hypothetical protein
MIAALLLLFNVAYTQEILVIKQWHLPPEAKTIDIESSKKLPQFTNQKAIYEKIAGMGTKTVTIISEGCAGDITKDSHYGWDYQKLAAKKDTPEFKEILAFNPAKLKAQLGDKANIVCADSEELMKKNLLAFSDLRAFTGYYIRLKQFKGKNEKNYAMFEKALLEKEGKLGKVDAIAYAKEKALNAIAEVERLIEERNQKFVAAAKETLAANPVIVIGGLHAKGIVKALEKEKIKFSIFVPEGYKESDENLIETLRAQFY